MVAWVSTLLWYCAVYGCTLLYRVYLPTLPYLTATYLCRLATYLRRLRPYLTFVDSYCRYSIRVSYLHSIPIV